MAQVQVLLEITDLEEGDFVQYVPGDQEVFVVTRVQRDRSWFAARKEQIETFIRVLRELQNEPETLGMLREDKSPFRFARMALGMDVEHLEESLRAETEYCNTIRYQVHVSDVRADTK